MNLTETVIEGTIQADGSLKLDEPTKLSAGRVQVFVQLFPKQASTERGLVEVMDEIRSGQQARGYSGRTLETMQAEEKDRQEEDAE